MTFVLTPTPRCWALEEADNPFVFFTLALNYFVGFVSYFVSNINALKFYNYKAG